MSEHDHDRRECRECGASLSSWCCEVCGGDPLRAAADVSLAELVSSWGRAVADSGALAPVSHVAVVH